MIVDMQLYFLLMLQYLIVAHNEQHIGLLDFSFSTFIPHILTIFLASTSVLANTPNI